MDRQIRTVLSAEFRRAFHEMSRAQYGLAARSQLIESGIGERTIDNRITTLELVRVLPGVYSIGEPVVTQDLHWMAATLAHRGCVISHRSATALWGLEEPKGTVEVSRVHSQRLRTRLADPGGPNPPRLPRPLIHGPRGLTDDDVGVCRGIPVTSVPRTILDAASTAPLRRLDNLIDEALVRRLVSEEELRGLLGRTRGRRGGANLRLAISDVLIPDGELRSVLELRMLKLCHDHSLPVPLTNQLIHGTEVDCLWPDAMLVVELDGRRTHETGGAFELDRERDARLVSLGYRVLRLTWRMVTRQPTETAQKVRDLLNLREN